MLFDVHNHIQFPAYDNDRDEAIERARKSGVKMIAVGTTIETSKEALDLAEKHPKDIWAIIGFHPVHTYSSYHDKNELRQTKIEKFDIKKMEIFGQSLNTVAIGECGLDYYRIKDQESKIKNEQKRLFLKQAELASKLNKPLMIHCRPSFGTNDAYEDLISLIADYKIIVPKIIHFFVGSREIAKKFLELGCYFTFGGVITFARSYDETISFIPLSNIMLETDAPYVSPAPFRSKRNEPAYVVEVAKKMAEIRSVDYDEIIKTTTANAQQVFKINYE